MLTIKIYSLISFKNSRVLNIHNSISENSKNISHKDLVNSYKLLEKNFYYTFFNLNTFLIAATPMVVGISYSPGPGVNLFPASLLALEIVKLGPPFAW